MLNGCHMKNVASAFWRKKSDKKWRQSLWSTCRIVARNTLQQCDAALDKQTAKMFWKKSGQKRFSELSTPCSKVHTARIRKRDEQNMVQRRENWKSSKVILKENERNAIEKGACWKGMLNEGCDETGGIDRGGGPPELNRRLHEDKDSRQTQPQVLKYIELR